MAPVTFCPRSDDAFCIDRQKHRFNGVNMIGKYFLKAGLGSLIGLASVVSGQAVHAQGFWPGVGIGDGNEASLITSLGFEEGQLNTWYLSRTDAVVAAGVDSNPETYKDAFRFSEFPDVRTTGLLEVNTGSRTGSLASSKVFGTHQSLGAYARSQDATIQTTLSAATNAISSSFFLVSDQAGRVDMELQLTGRLSIGSPLELKQSEAGVVFFGLGSTTNQQSWETYPFDQWYGPEGDEGYAPNAVPFKSPNFVASSYHLGVGFSAELEVNEQIILSAEGIPFSCLPEASILCGKYLYAFHLVLSTGTENDGVADFMNTLTINALRVPQGMDVRFINGETIQVSAVPEPSTVWLLLSGMVMVGTLVRVRTPRHS